MKFWKVIQFSIKNILLPSLIFLTKLRKAFRYPFPCCTPIYHGLKSSQGRRTNSTFYPICVCVCVFSLSLSLIYFVSSVLISTIAATTPQTHHSEEKRKSIRIPRCAVGFIDVSTSKQKPKRQRQSECVREREREREMMRLNAFTRKCVNLTKQRKSTLSCFLSETKAR